MKQFIEYLKEQETFSLMSKPQMENASKHGYAVTHEKDGDYKVWKKDELVKSFDNMEDVNSFLNSELGIKELKEDGNNVYGKAKIMETPMGKIVRNLMAEGASLGVSSRGMGSLKKLDTGINEVQNDFMLSAVDIVADPSAPDAFVNGIMEGKEWVWDNGILKETDIHKMCCELQKTSTKHLEEKTIDIFKKFLSKL